MSAFQDLQSRLRKTGAPATFILIGVLLVTFVVSWLTRGAYIESFAFVSTFVPPWGILTFPFASSGDGQALFFFLILLWWFYWVGTSMEREVGSAKLVGFFFASSILAALFLLLGGVLTHRLIAEFGPALAISALTVAWGARNPKGTILLYGIIPLTGQILMWLTIALDLFGYGSRYGTPLMGVFACIHLGVAYMFAKGMLPGMPYAAPSASSKVLKAQEKRHNNYYDDVRKREQERADRERLRKLFEGSLQDDEDGPKK
jgi:hypothetical protein